MSMISNLLAVPQAELDDLFKNPETISTVLYETRSKEVVDFDKAWQAIHFMLTGQPFEGEPPLSHAIFGVEMIGEEDVGYGPALGTSSEMVKEIADALSVISDAEFCSRYDAAAMMELGVYPQIWDEEDVLDEYILPNFKTLQAFYSKASENGFAVITFIN